MKLVIDTNILGKLCHPKNAKNHEVAEWFLSALRDGQFTFYLPSIADYELRRELIRGIRQNKLDPKSLERLDQLGLTLDFIELESRTLKAAATMWAEARMGKGKPTAPDDSLDGDVLLAAQAKEVGASVLTENKKHISRYVDVKTLSDLIDQKKDK
jgi:toxin FitB